MSFTKCPICIHPWQPCQSDSCDGCSAEMQDDGTLTLPRRSKGYRDSNEFEIATFLAAGASEVWVSEWLGVDIGQVPQAAGRFAIRAVGVAGVAFAPVEARTAAWYADALDALRDAEMGGTRYTVLAVDSIVERRDLQARLAAWLKGGST